MIIQRRNGRIIHGVGLQRARTPHRDPSCFCAFDADPGYYVRNGSGVSQWNDITGHGYHALQPTALNQPTWIESDPDFRGHGSLAFDGSASHLFVSAISIQTGFTWYSVVKFGTNSKSKTIVDQYNTPTKRQAFSIDVRGRISGFAASGILSGVTDLRGQLCVVAFVANGSGSALYANSLTPVATGNAGPSTMADLCIGAYGGTTNFLDGKMGALYGFVGAHGAAKSAKMLQYLGSKYGVSIT